MRINEYETSKKYLKNTFQDRLVFLQFSGYFLKNIFSNGYLNQYRNQVRLSLHLRLTSTTTKPLVRESSELFHNTTLLGLN